MKNNIFMVLMMILAGFVLSGQAQLGNLKNKINNKAGSEQKKHPQPTEGPADNRPAESRAGTSGDAYQNSDFLFIGRNDMDGDGIGALTACVPAMTASLSPPASKSFKGWITEISETAALRTFENGKCDVIGFAIVDNPQYKYRSVESLVESAQGRSVYKLAGEKLALVKKFEAAQFFIVVVPDRVKPGLKLSELRLCGSPDTIKQFRRKTESVSNCHDLEQSLYIFEKYKNYPGPMQDNSVIFAAADFEQLSKQGKFRGLAIYRLVGEELVPAK